MTDQINESHDPNLKSWVASANDPTTDFPIQNLPMMTFLRPDADAISLGVAIGDQAVDVSMLVEAGLFDDLVDEEDLNRLVEEGSLAPLMEAPADLLSAFRGEIRKFLRDGDPGGQQGRRLRTSAVIPVRDLTFLPPCAIPNYTDFYASIHHATTVGSMFRPENPLLPNYKWVPIGYHGRASSVVASGTEIIRPRGQQKADDAPGAPPTPPTFGPSTMLDFELEVGAFIGRGNDLGVPISIEEAENHLFGLCLVNDWSARDLQKWEYQPLGPFLAKNFATTISPFIVTMEALAPFRCPAYVRPVGDPGPLSYLSSPQDKERGGFNIMLEVFIVSRQMREQNLPPHRITRTPFKDMYWTLAQLLTHHASGGCNMQPGDLIASGTVSGTTPDTKGCLLEMSWQGRDESGKPKPRRGIELPTGEKRLFLEDGDEVILRGSCERPGYRRIGFGECRGIVMPAIK